MSDRPISTAFAAAAGAIAAVLGISPIKGLHVAETDGWKLTINASMEPVACEGLPTPIGPYEIHAEGKIYLAFGVLDPFGGMVGGIDEDSFIAEMEAIAATHADGAQA